MDRAHEASAQLSHQRAGRLRALRVALARLATSHARAEARGDARMVAHYAGQIRRAEQSLAALERTIADAEPPS